MSEQKTIMNLQEIISDIEKSKILLPDFQRKFVWTEEERQRKIVASILAKMPIGSILLLESNPSDYSSKIIGCRTVNENNSESKVEFLLDGQQRITVLTNVFSNVIHNNCSRVSDLVSPTLKRRFFLRIPKWNKHQQELDLFGVHNLNFPYKDPDSTDPDFLSGDILPFIICISFNTGDANPFNPENDLSTNLDDFCLNHDEGYLVPLFLMTPSSEPNSSQVKLRLNTIRKSISEKIKAEIEDYFISIDDDQKNDFIHEIFGDDIKTCEMIKAKIDLFGQKLSERADVWEGELKEYLDSCVKNVSLNKIVVSAEKRARAIDIYENLNIGGICLNIFDLIMAKVAKVDNTPYYDRLINCIKSKKVYPKDVIPHDIFSCMTYEKKINNNGTQTKEIVSLLEETYYNASIWTRCYSEEKNEISSKYVDAFLNTLSLYSYNKEYKADKYKVELIKRAKILDISPKEIHDNTEMICNALDRALFFFQTRCGIRNINEINYSLMLSLVATVFTNDKWFMDITVHNRLEAWYWCNLFSGGYDRDQNTVFIQDLQSVTNMLTESNNVDWISRNIEYILDAQNFSDEQLLLMEKTNEDRVPKRILRTFICQYLLSQTYTDMFNKDETLSVFSKNSHTLEAHHIIPLGSAKKVNESTAELRKDDRNLCNSPLNFVFITKSSNDMISDSPLNIYITKITDEAKAALSIQGYNSTDIDQDTISQLLKDRYVALKGNIKAEVRKLLL